MHGFDQAVPDNVIGPPEQIRQLTFPRPEQIDAITNHRGDVSLAYGKTLYELGNHDGAREHLEGHIQRWRHPGSLFLLATLEHEQKNHKQAREHLHAMLQDINSSPKAIARKFGIWKSKARKLLRKLPR